MSATVYTVILAVALQTSRPSVRRIVASSCPKKMKRIRCTRRHVLARVSTSATNRRPVDTRARRACDGGARRLSRESPALATSTHGAVRLAAARGRRSGARESVLLPAVADDTSLVRHVESQHRGTACARRRTRARAHRPAPGGPRRRHTRRARSVRVGRDHVSDRSYRRVGGGKHGNEVSLDVMRRRARSRNNIAMEITCMMRDTVAVTSR